MTHRAIITSLHSFCVNVDRLPAARDKALKIIGRWLRTNVKLLSHMGWVRWSYRLNCTIRHCTLSRHGSSNSRYLICRCHLVVGWIQKWVIQISSSSTLLLRVSRGRRGSDLRRWNPRNRTHNLLIRGRSKQGLNLWDMLCDKLCNNVI